MKIKLYLIFSVLVACTVFAQTGKNELIITLNRRAVIAIDGNIFYGDTVKTKVEPGYHIVRIKNNLRSWDLDTILDTIKIDKNTGTIYKSYVLPEIHYIQSIPDDALVFAGSKFIGYTPLLVFGNSGNLKLSKKNYKSKSLLLSKKDLTVKLESINHQINHERFIDDVWFKVLLGGIVTSGAASAYFKLKADKYYDQYLTTKDEALLSKTNRYDLISGIALGVLQINFGLLIYRFLIE